MGLNFLASSSSFDCDCKKAKAEYMEWPPRNLNPNPDASKYTIIEHFRFRNYLVIKIKYEGCTNYEGIKILAFKCSYSDLIKQKLIDPHFSENKKMISPIARFEPTIQGWSDAIDYIKTRAAKDGGDIVD